MADYPGCGKTSLVEEYKHKTLFVTPSNKLAQQLRKDKFQSKTLHKFLNIRVNGESKEHKPSKNKDFDSVCFDEIGMYTFDLHEKIFLYMRNNPQLKYMCTIDRNQLIPYGKKFNNIQAKDKDKYLELIINSMFHTQILLKINKRMHSIQDRLKLRDLKADIFNTQIPIVDIIKKYGFKTISKWSEINTLNNISYFKFRVNQVNKYVHNHLVEQPEDKIIIDNIAYWENLTLVCKYYYQKKDILLLVNEEYILKKINKKEFTIYDQEEKKDITLPIDKLYLFILPYCNSCHSVQGLSMKVPTTIFDSNLAYTSRRWFWTALTRITEFNNVQFFIHSDEEVKQMTTNKMKQYFNFKVDSYKQQDEIAGRQFNETEYITADWFISEFEKSKVCPSCNNEFEIAVDDENEIESNITANRIDNSKPHHISNCELCCLSCNRALK